MTKERFYKEECVEINEIAHLFIGQRFLYKLLCDWLVECSLALSSFVPLLFDPCGLPCSNLSEGVVCNVLLKLTLIEFTLPEPYLKCISL